MRKYSRMVWIFVLSIFAGGCVFPMAVPSSPVSTVVVEPITVLTATGPALLETSASSSTPNPKLTEPQKSSPTPTIPPITPIIIADPNYLPILTHDLQFRRDDVIWLWDHLSNQINKKVDMGLWKEGVVFPSFSFLGDKLFRISGQGNSDDPGSGPIDWEVIDLDSGQVNLLQHFETGPGKEKIFWELIAPDGKWIVYCRADWIEQNNFANNTMVLISTTSPSEIKEYGYCDKDALIRWSPDNRSWIWTVSGAIWFASLEIPANQIYPSPGNENPNGFILGESGFSSTGRFMIVGLPGPIEGVDRGVLDINNQRLEVIPDTWQAAIPAGCPTWISQERVFVLHPGDLTGNNEYPPYGKVWLLNPGGPKMLVGGELFSLDDIDPGFIPVNLFETDSGQLMFLVLPGNNDYAPQPPPGRWDAGIYSIDPNHPKPRKMNTLPEGLGDPVCGVNPVVYWMPDGTGALIEYLPPKGNAKRYLFVPASGGPLFDLTSMIGEGAVDFSWIP